MTDDGPLDLTQVAADEAALEQLRLSTARPDDSALELLRDLLVDVERDLPRSAPVGQGSTVLRLAGESTPDPRVARGGTVVAVLAAGMVVFGGVAAASTAVAPGNPLHGFGEGVRAAAVAVVDAVKPPETTRDVEPATGAVPAPAADRAAEALASRPSPAASGAATAAAARSDAAARQVGALLDEAERLLAEGRAPAADQRLDLAERRLAEVSAEAAAPLRTRLDDLRRQVDAALAAQQKAPAKADPGPKPKPGGPADRKPATPKQPAKDSSRAGPKADPAPPADREQPTSPGRDGAGSADDAEDAADAPASAPGQPSRLASTKPRA